MFVACCVLQMHKQQGDICRGNSGNAEGLPDSCRTYVAQLDDSLFFKAWTCS